jgi:hypothetical protein
VRLVWVLALSALACGARTGLLGPTTSESTPDGGGAIGDAGEADADSAATTMACPIAAGTAVTLATNDGVVNGMAVDATYLYWADDTNVLAVPLCGGSVVTVGTGENLGGLALDATSVYWTQVPFMPSGPQYTLFRTDKHTLATTALATLPTGAGGAVAVDATTAYFASGADCNINDSNCPTGEVLSVPITGGAVTTLVSQNAAPVVGIAVDATRVYFATAGQSAGTGFIASVPKTGGTVATLASAQGFPRELVLGGTTLVWRDDFDGTVETMPVGGGAPSTVISGQLVAKCIAASATTAYVGTVLGSVEGVDLATAAVSDVTTTDLPGPTGMVTQGTSLYWAGSEVVRYGLK